MNNISVAGNLTRDCEKRNLPSGEAIVSFGLADNQGRDAQGNDKPPIFWNCSLFGKRGEALAQYLTKGTSVTVVGNITEREWTDKEGNARKTMDIRVSDLALQGSRQQGAAPAQGTAQPAQRRAVTQAPTRVPAPAAAPASQFEEDDIPF